ncbi:FAD-dependent oxidoreductase [Ruminococcus gauvreauii]|uniref:FAD-dependent oxidoreductase n=1 Tax=Ruminococcus gauvreauii TaxID=438033 RepID=A0ABY5VKW5_9FIRM|nr:FAD-dependent oxidoreductase [Ruminococcus gauvreauii]UWP60168.1 FAD-dependent oxidoreductase [Ruminococcus gauvreauii]
MKVLIIGGVAAGTKAAAKLKRENQDAEVTILTMSKDISYAGCGLPYYVGGVIQERSELIVNTPENFSKLTGALVETGVEVTGLDRENRSVKAVRTDTGEETCYTYDKLVIATGASPVKPPVEGVDLKHVYFMRTPDDAEALRCAVDSGEIKRAVVAGGGFIGLEVAENLKEKGIRVTVIDMAPQIMPGFDHEVAEYAEEYLADQGIVALTGTKLEGILGDGKVEKVKTDKRTLKADAVILSLGIRANTGFLADTGIELMPNRTIKVNEYLQTNDEDIYALGDCAMVTNRITGEHAWSPMGSSANMEGRIAAKNICGEKIAYPGVLGTGVVKLPGLNAGRTGLSEEAASAAGFDPVSVVTVVDDKAHYYPGAGSFIVKMVADRKTGKFLGIQCLGKGAVDKMVDIAVMALSMKASIQDLEHLDFAYAPPFSTAIHPFVHTVNVLLNKMSGEFLTMTPVEFAKGEASDYRIIDASPAPSIEGVPYVDLTTVNGEVEGLGKEEKLLLVCSKGKRAYLLQNRLKHYGYTNTRVLEGGTTFNGKDLA